MQGRMKDQQMQSKEHILHATQGLDQGQQRILRWLDRYPFQRAQDLVIALAPWESRAAVYRRLSDLQARHLIETMRLGVSTRERLYHLSPLGQQIWNAHTAGKERRTVLALREEREKLTNVLPRLPVWLLVQNVVNGLVLHAARALTRAGTGEEASSVRWNWLREYRHPFVAREQAERVLNVRAEGAMALCMRFSDLEEWHTFLLLHCPLDDRRILRTRLDRLVRWRESAERTSSDQVPPLLILATSLRQAEWWHMASAQVATRLHTEEPLGAVVVLPQGASGNSWRLPWRTLGTNAPCHLQDLTRPLTTPSVPELGETAAPWSWAGQRSLARQEAARMMRVPAVAGKHSYGLAARTAPNALSRRHQRDYCLTSATLSRRHWEILSLLFAHPLLSREDLSVFCGMGEKSVQMILADLAQKGMLTQAVTQIGGRWHLTEAGLRLLARHAACHVSRFVRAPVAADAPLQQRGLAGLLHQMRHTAGVYTFFASLVRQGARLCWWETGGMCEHFFHYRERLYHFQPDAFAAVQTGGRQMRFWLEWDRGTMGVRDLERKCATYAAYLSSREWARGGISPPVLLYVAPEIAQERRFQRCVRALLTHLPGLRLYTTTTSFIATRGVLEAIWQPVALHDPPLRPESPARVAVFGINELHPSSSIMVP